MQEDENILEFLRKPLVIDDRAISQKLSELQYFADQTILSIRNLDVREVLQELKKTNERLKQIEKDIKSIKNSAIGGLIDFSFTDKQNEFLDSQIDEIEMTVRLTNCVSRLGMKTFRDILKAGKKSFLESRNFGKKSLDELQLIFDMNEVKFN